MKVRKMIVMTAMAALTAGAIVPPDAALAGNSFSFSISKMDENDGSDPVKKTNDSYTDATFTIDSCDIDVTTEMIRFRVLKNENDVIASEYKNYPGIGKKTHLVYTNDHGVKNVTYRLRSHYVSGSNQVNGNGTWTP